MSNRLQVVKRGKKFGALKEHFETSGSPPGAPIEVAEDPGTHLKTTDLLDHYYDESTSQEATHALDDIVQNPIGRIGMNTTISQLRAKYKTLDHLVSAMLNVATRSGDRPVGHSLYKGLLRYEDNNDNTATWRYYDGTTWIDLARTILNDVALTFLQWTMVVDTAETGAGFSATTPYSWSYTVKNPDYLRPVGSTGANTEDQYKTFSYAQEDNFGKILTWFADQIFKTRWLHYGLDFRITNLAARVNAAGIPHLQQEQGA